MVAGILFLFCMLTLQYFQFCGNVKGAESSALVYSLVEATKAMEMNLTSIWCCSVHAVLPRHPQHMRT